MALASFLRPVDSPRATSFAIGNATTCSISGFMTTAAHSGTFYTCMLSYYFLFTARFGLKNSFIARRIEPVMHCIALGYPIVSAIVGAYYDAYADTATYFGCFVNCPPGKNKEDCIATTLGWIFYGWPFLFVLASLIVNNLLIWFLVHGHSVTLRKKSTSRQIHGSSHGSSAVKSSLDVDDSFHIDSMGVENTAHGQETTAPSSSDNAKKENMQTPDAPKDNQLRRLQLVKSQAFLFVGSYALAAMWGGFMAVGEQQAVTEDEELSLLVKMYPIMVLNAVFAPMQGFFNMLVYARPKYLTTRHQFRDQSRWWAMKRAILGGRTSRKPKIPKRSAPDMKEVPKSLSAKDGVKPESEAVQNKTVSLKRDALSTLTASRGDFSDEASYYENLNDEEKDRWGSNRHDTCAPMKQAPRYYSSLQERDSSLGIISEMTETQFDPIIDHSHEMKLEGDHRFRAQQGDSIPAFSRSTPIYSPSTVDSRWSPKSVEQGKLLASVDLMMPQRVSSTSEMHCINDQLAGPSIDTPLQTPMRTSSLVEPKSEIDDDEADVSLQHSPLPPPAPQASVLEGTSSDRTLRPPARRLSPPRL
ncbi:unnamed protein product [Cylindrotheca closterium]|uniref:Uncharacterized protein n=1 Tax=Cylindrotheca closterium TaxID=2856 RepID=A0AAD2FE30_9STRA|nr:unnamed protein product [Cylindrotheca closterium]